MVVTDVFTRRIIGFGIAAANLDGIRVWRMFNRAIARQTMARQPQAAELGPFEQRAEVFFQLACILRRPIAGSHRWLHP